MTTTGQGRVMFLKCFSVIMTAMFTQTDTLDTTSSKRSHTAIAGLMFAGSFMKQSFLTAKAAFKDSERLL